MTDLCGVEIFATGFRHGARVTVEDLDAMVEAFQLARLHTATRIKVQHRAMSDLRFGHVENVRREGSTLLADLIGIPDRLLDDYRFCSAETLTPATVAGRTFRRALTSISLTDRPGCYGLADLYGNRTNELCVRPTGPHGFETFVVENEAALYVAETLLDNNEGDEYEFKAQASGHGLLRIGYVPHTEDGSMIKRLQAAASVELNGESRGISGRIGGGDFAMIAPAFEARTETKMEMEYLSIRKVTI